ncbi:unnamed protein product [Meganyctiphanes norvegica]|uniref:Uncharacterized protein n=1 Tax=Meganyctiphanes norvegica TaxID=48144 RepID=A0AAV2SWI2_MEGNR
MLKSFFASYMACQVRIIDKARLKLFLKKNNPDALPPTRDALYLHVKRAYYHSLIWKMANCPRPILPDPAEWGWEMTDIGLKPILMIKNGIPESALKFISCNCTTNCRNNRCGCRKANLPCTLYCGYVKNYVIFCVNAPNTIHDEEED